MNFPSTYIDTKIKKRHAGIVLFLKFFQHKNGLPITESPFVYTEELFVCPYALFKIINDLYQFLSGYICIAVF